MPIDYPELAAAILKAEGDLLVDLDRRSAEAIVLVVDLFPPLARYVADIGDAEVLLGNGAKRQSC